MDTPEYTPFEKHVHHICTIHLCNRDIEKKLYTITLSTPLLLYSYLEKYKSFVTNPVYSSWMDSCLYNHYLGTHEKKIIQLSLGNRDRKEQRLVIRKVMRLMHSDMKILRICDMILVQSIRSIQSIQFT